MKKVTKYDGTINSICAMLPGGRQTLMKLARVTAERDLDIARLITKWDELPETTQRRCKLELLCQDVGIEWPQLVAAATEAAIKGNNMVSPMLAAIEQPAIIAKMAKFAQRPKHVKDREMILQHTGFLPRPAGATVQILQNIATVEAAEGSVLVPFEKSIIDSDEILHKLPAPKPTLEGFRVTEDKTISVLKENDEE